MRLDLTFLLSTYLVVASALAAGLRTDVARREPIGQHFEPESHGYGNELEKRRGGGGGGGGRGGGGSSSGGGRSGNSGSSGNRGSGTTSSSSGSSSGSGSGRASSSSNSGGRTTTGTGPAPAYGGGRYYGGGAAVPYKAGSKSPSGITPLLFGAGLGLAFWPGVWLAGAWLYPYSRPYTFYNATSRVNETKPITCGCDPTLVCGCDENQDTQYLSDIIGNGTNLNSSIVSVGVQDGVQRILINGRLPNGTTAAGGNDDPSGSSAGAGMQMLLRNAGWWPVVALDSAMVFTA